MAILRKNMLSGLVGPLVFSVVKNRQIVKKNVPTGKIKQTKGTKKAAGIFGKASAFGKQIRMVYDAEIIGFQDTAMALRMTNVLNQILPPCRNPKDNSYTFSPGSFDKLQGFDFNIKSPLKRSLLSMPAITLENKVLNIEFAERKLTDALLFPFEAYACDLTVAVALFRLGPGLKSTYTQTSNFNIIRSQPNFNVAVLQFDVPDGCLFTIALFLTYHYPYKNLSVIINSKDFSPAGILEATLSPGVFSEDHKYHWTRMNDINFEKA